MIRDDDNRRVETALQQEAGETGRTRSRSTRPRLRRAVAADFTVPTSSPMTSSAKRPRNGSTGSYPSCGSMDRITMKKGPSGDASRRPPSQPTAWSMSASAGARFFRRATSGQNQSGQESRQTESSGCAERRSFLQARSSPWLGVPFRLPAILSLEHLSLLSRRRSPSLPRQLGQLRGRLRA